MKPAKSESIDGVVHNTALPGSNLGQILGFCIEHIAEWADRDVIWFVDALDLTHISEQDVRWFIARGEQVTLARQGRKTAIVARPDLHFGMMRMLASLAEGRFHMKLGVFRDLASAPAWIQGPRE